jgi:hypothetical protein
MLNPAPTRRGLHEQCEVDSAIMYKVYRLGYVTSRRTTEGFITVLGAFGRFWQSVRIKKRARLVRVKLYSYGDTEYG